MKEHRWSIPFTIVMCGAKLENALGYVQIQHTKNGFYTTPTLKMAFFHNL